MKVKKLVSMAAGLVLCAGIGGSPALAATSTASLQGNYSCTGTGTDHDGDFPFSVSGVLTADTGGTTLTTPPGSNWVWDVAGVGLIDIVVTSGTWSATPNGQGTIALNYIPPSVIIPAFPFVLSFNNQLVMDSLDANGVAHGFRITIQPPPTYSGIVAAVDCRAQSDAVGNPLP